MNKVYITQDLGRINYLPAEQYGELEVVIEGRVSHLGLKRSMTRMQDAMRDITKDDWIIPSGHPALIALAGYITIRSGRSEGSMKIIAVDNLARDSVADRLVAANVNASEGTLMLKALQDTCFPGGDTWYQLKEDDYRLSRGMEDLV